VLWQPNHWPKFPHAGVVRPGIPYESSE
jgi:hypothetical protein